MTYFIDFQPVARDLILENEFNDYSVYFNKWMYNKVLRI